MDECISGVGEFQWSEAGLRNNVPPHRSTFRQADPRSTATERRSATTEPRSTADGGGDRHGGDAAALPRPSSLRFRAGDSQREIPTATATATTTAAAAATTAAAASKRAGDSQRARDSQRRPRPRPTTTTATTAAASEPREGGGNQPETAHEKGPPQAGPFLASELFGCLDRRADYAAFCASSDASRSAIRSAGSVAGSVCGASTSTGLPSLTAALMRLSTALLIHSPLPQRCAL